MGKIRTWSPTTQGDGRLGSVLISFPLAFRKRNIISSDVENRARTINDRDRGFVSGEAIALKRSRIPQYAAPPNFTPVGRAVIL